MKKGFAVVLLLATTVTLLAGERTPAPKAGTNSATALELRGKMVCLSEEMQRLYAANVPEKHQHDYGFRTESGAFYSLVRTPLSEALLTDTNLHSKNLVLKGRTFPKSQLFEVTGNLHSIRDGKLNELYYYCDICSIKGSVPGPCLCCREPVHLVEEPVK